MTSKFIDTYGNPLREQIYFSGGKLDGNIYYIKLKSDGSSFSAENPKGNVSIENHKLFASNLIPLADPLQNIMFAVSKLEGSLVE